MKQAVNPLEIMEWMEAFLMCYPSNSVRVMIMKFKEEIERNDIKHRIHLRRLRKGKQNVPNMQRLRFTPFTLYKPLQMPVQSTQRESQEGVCESGPTEAT